MASAPGRAERGVEREANYLAVGSFVLLVAVMGALFVYWYSDSREHRNYQRYEIYFDGSVSGLTEGGAVRYLGVDVGRVQRMRIDPRAANRVQIVADIDATTPISDRTIAQLQLQGVTGLLYIDLTLQREVEGRLLEAVPSENYPVIRSAHSDFDVFLSSLPDLTARLNEWWCVRPARSRTATSPRSRASSAISSVPRRGCRRARAISTRCSASCGYDHRCAHGHWRSARGHPCRQRGLSREHEAAACHERQSGRRQRRARCLHRRESRAAQRFRAPGPAAARGTAARQPGRHAAAPGTCPAA